MIRQLLQRLFIQPFVHVLARVEQHFKDRFCPATVHPALGVAMDVTRSKSQLIAENAFLGQQLVVLCRQTKRPALTHLDRGLLVLLASRLQVWTETLLIVKPDTLLGWHRQGFRLFWRHKSKGKRRQPCISQEVIALIHTMALDNRLWGTKRIQDELRKLGYPLAKRTVARYIRQSARPSHLERVHKHGQHF